MAYQFGVGEYVTEGGKKAEVLAERNGVLIGFIYDSAHVSEICVCRWMPDGKPQFSHHLDRLLPPKQTRKVWLNVYDTFVAIHENPLVAKNASTTSSGKHPKDLVACVPVTIEFAPGDGLQD